jgi:Ca-activated chloride channel homolog
LSAVGARAVLLAAGLTCAAVSAAWAQDAVLRRGFSIRITAPGPSDYVTGPTRIAADVRVDDPSEVDRVEFLVKDKVVFVDREPPYECTYDFGEDSKAWVIRAIAYHKEGFSVSDVVVTRKITISSIEEVNRVILWVTVTDRNDVVVDPLSKDDFQVTEDGVPQEIREFTREDRPITMAIVLDSSGSMRDSMKSLHEAAASFVATLRPVDRALVIDFDDKVFLLQDATSDQVALKDAVTSTEALGSTALYDALHAAYRKLKGIEGRKAIILLTDGDDTSSQVGYERMLEEVRGGSDMIFAIGLGAARKSVLKEFADTTGGRAYFVSKAAELAGVYKKIAEELRRQYYIAYQTSNTVWNGRFVKLAVVAKNKDWTVRARKGYFAVHTTPPKSRAK